MRIHRSTLRNYRGTTERSVEFADGVTVVEGRNEAGKSTLVEALRHVRMHKASANRADIRATQPVGREVGPEVEIEISTGGYRLTYCKQWIKGKKTELHITSPRHEALSGDEAHERFLQIIAETTDEGLFEALEVMQGDSLGQAQLAQLPALRRALDVVGASHEEHDDLLDIVENEYLRYFTATGRPNAEYVRAHKELEDLEQEVRNLEEASREIDSLAERHAETTAARLSKEESLGRAREQIAELAEASRSLDELRQRVAEADQQVADAAVVLDVAEKRARERDELKGIVTELEDALSEMRIRVRQEQDDLAEAEAVWAACLTGARGAQEKERTLRRHLREIALRVQRARDAAELKVLKARLEKLEEAERRLYEAMATLSVNTIDDELCLSLEKLEVAARVSHEAWEASAASISLEISNAIVLDGEVLETGEYGPVPVKDLITIEVPGSACIRIYPGEGTEDVEQRARGAADALAEALAEHGVPDVAAARVAAREHANATRERDAAYETIQAFSGDEGGAELRSRVDLLSAVLEGAEPRDLTALEKEHVRIGEAWEAAEARVEEIRARLETRRGIQQSARERGIRTEAEMHNLQARRDEAGARLELARQEASDEAITAAVADAEIVLESRRAGQKAVAQALEATNAPALEFQLSNASSVVDRLEQECKALDDELARLSALLEDRLAGGAYDRLADAAARQRHAETSHASRRRAAEAVNLLRQTLRRHRSEAQLRYVAPFRERIEALGRLVFGPTLEVDVAPDLSISSRTVEGETIAFGSLSSGAREQLSLLGRLACAQLVQPGEGVPLIIDDALGFADPERLRRLGAVLNRVGETVQTIILTCQPERFEQIGTAQVVRL